MEGVELGLDTGARPLRQNKVAGAPIEAGSASVDTQRQERGKQNEIADAKSFSVSSRQKRLPAKKLNSN